jgi:hypothetical protein
MWGGRKKRIRYRSRVAIAKIAKIAKKLEKLGHPIF